MTLLAAAASDHAGLGPLWLLAGLWALGYLTACVVWPFKPCRRCDGAARLRSPSGTAWRRCPRCRGTGRRVRAGRRIWDRARSTTRT